MEILNYDEAPEGTNLIATFSVYIGPLWGVTYNGIALRNGKHGRFIAIPSKCKEVDGEKKFTPIIEFSKEKKAEFDTKVMELLKGFVNEG